MKKIVHIIPNFSFGGAEKYLLDVLRNYDYTQHEVSVITLMPNVHFFDTELNKIKGLSVYSLNIKSLKKITWVWSFYKILNKIKPNVVHSHLNLALIVLILFKKIIKAKYVLTQHSVYNNTSFYYKTLIKLTSYYDYVLSNSNYTRAFLIKNKYIKDSKILNYSLGVDFSRYEVDRSRRESVLDSLNIANDKIVIGNIGSFKFHKGHIHLIDVFEKSLKNKKNLHLLLVGGGILKKSIIEVVKSKGLANNVTFIDSTTNVSKFFNCFDVYCSTSVSESFGITLLEAILFQVPIVSFNTDAIPELVIDGKTGVLVEKNDTNQFSKELLGLLKTPSLIKYIKLNQKDYAEKYKIKNHVEKLISFYNTI